MTEEVTLYASSAQPKAQWCLDSGCSSHMIANKDVFDKYSHIEKPVNLTNNDVAKISGVGEVKMVVNNGNNQRSWIIDVGSAN